MSTSASSSILRTIATRLVVGILLLAPCEHAFAADSKPIVLAPNPEWCRPGYRCLTIDDYAAMTVVKVNLEERVSKLQSRARHFGLGCSVGPGLGLVVDADLHTRLVPSAVGATCGATVRF